MTDIPRREFLKYTALGASSLALSSLPLGSRVLNLCPQAHAFELARDLSNQEARYYRKLDDLIAECELCPRNCKVADRERGYCGVRENRGGVYYTLVYSRPCSLNIDPIEKKPLFHFLPGTTAFSMATAGCNVNCKFCQNWDISQVRPEQTRNYDLPPQELVELALQYKAPTIAYTYSEPIIFYEYMYDTAKLGHQRGVRSVMISGGYIREKPLVDLVGHLDAVKIDLKAFTESYYKDVCHGELKPVLDCLVTLKKQGIWTEIVYLVVPTLNDRKSEIADMSAWILENLGPDVPVHFTRFHPMYLLKNLPSTPVKTLEMARRTALDKGLNYVYIGNVPGHEGENTYCPGCGKIIIQRVGFRILKNEVVSGKCRHCGKAIPGVWS
jgi:pyruvate formate lyase activating enzyme